MGVGLREVVQPGVNWVIGDGGQIRFWTDKWLSGTPLLDEASEDKPEGFEVMLARDLWRYGSGWDFDRIAPHVSENRRLELAAVVLDNVTGAKDRISWGGRSDGLFSVKSAHSLLTRDNYPKPDMRGFYDRIWKLAVPERVRVFLCMVGNQAIMSNAERCRRHLCDSNICPVCKSGVETIIHIERLPGYGGDLVKNYTYKEAANVFRATVTWLGI